MKELIVVCVILYSDDSTEVVKVDVLHIGIGGLHEKSIKNYVKENHSGQGKTVKDVQIVDVWIVTT